MTIDSQEQENHVTSVLNPTFQYVYILNNEIFLNFERF